jgi:hypothetical protein
MFLTLAFWTQLILSGISSFIYPSKVNEGSLSPYCPPTVPSYTVDLSGSPSGVWNSPANVGRNDQCNCTLGTEFCLEFVITLNPNAIGFVLRKTAGSQAGGNQDYIVNGDCSNIGTLDDRFCVTGTGPYYIAYCESGGNTHTYQVESIESDFLPASFCSEPGIATQLTVSGSVDPLTATWTAVSSNASTSFLTASSGTLSTYFNPPDTISKNQIFTYEVCANSNISICDNVIPICTTVDVQFYDVIPNSANWVNPPGTITINCDQAENYVIPNLSYTNGETGDKLISGSVPGIIKSGGFNECGGQWTIEWSYTNACTGTITHQQIINIDPAPTANWVNPPADMTITCDEAANYVIPNLSYSNGESGSCEISGSVQGSVSGYFNECGGVFIITWTFTDDCSRTINHTQQITIQPAPISSWINAPGPLELTCDEAENYVIPDLSYTNSSLSSCLITGSVPGTIQSGSFTECGGSWVLLWEYTDDCGNRIEHTQDVNILPAAPPQWVNPPGPTTFTCAQAENYVIPNLSYSNGESGSCEISGSVAGVIQSGSFNECGGSWIIAWTFTDDCGNRIEHTQNITIDPAYGPQFINPPANDTLTVEEFQSYQIPNLAYTNAEPGSCLIQGQVAGKLISGGASSCCGDAIIFWVYTDDCSRAIGHYQKIVIENSFLTPQAQWINPPANTTITCSDALTFTAPSLSYTNNTSDSCLISGSVAPTISSNFTECGGTITVDWDFTDECGRNIHHTQIVTVEPAPSQDWINPPGSISISCDAALSFTAPDLFYNNGESGSCEIAGSVSPVIIPNFDECGGTITVDWDFTDNCGRNHHHTQVVTVDPAPAATWINAPGSITISCFEATIYTAPDLNYTNGGSGSCEIAGSVTPVIIPNFDECGGTITVDWDFTDNCGRNHHHTQVITVEEAPAPNWINPPMDDTISCTEANNYVIPSLAYSNGNNGTCKIEGSIAGTISGAYEDCTGGWIAQWSYTDNCGRNITHSQSITILPDICDQDIDYINSVPPTEWNNADCDGDGELNYLEAINGTDPYDACSRYSNIPSPPQWINPQSNISLSCEEALEYSSFNLSYTTSTGETCIQAGTIVASKSTNYGSCGEDWVLTWSFTDLFGQTIQHQQTISVSEQECSSSDNDLDIPEIALQSQTIASKKNIRSRGRINNGSKVNFFAGESIILRPGFSVSAGAEFSARIQDCIDVSSNTNSSTLDLDIDIESPVTTSIKDIRIYPNPFTSTINIEIDGANSPIDIGIYSIQGQLIRTLNKTELNSISLDLSNLESGVYVVKVVGKDFTESRRIVKSF